MHRRLVVRSLPVKTSRGSRICICQSLFSFKNNISVPSSTPTILSTHLVCIIGAASALIVLIGLFTYVCLLHAKRQEKVLINILFYFHD